MGFIRINFINVRGVSYFEGIIVMGWKYKKSKEELNIFMDGIFNMGKS